MRFSTIKPRAGRGPKKICTVWKCGGGGGKTGCGEVSRALAAGLHGSRVLCQQLATTKWVQTWLALAFPEHILPPSSSVDETALREETRCCVERSVHKNKGNLETRENALSCLCSVTQVIKANRCDSCSHNAGNRLSTSGWHDVRWTLLFWDSIRRSNPCMTLTHLCSIE